MVLKSFMLNSHAVFIICKDKLVIGDWVFSADVTAWGQEIIDIRYICSKLYSRG